MPFVVDTASTLLHSPAEIKVLLNVKGTKITAPVYTKALVMESEAALKGRLAI